MNLQEFSERIFPEELRPIYLTIYGFVASVAVLFSIKLFWAEEQIAPFYIALIAITIGLSVVYLRWNAFQQHQKIIFRINNVLALSAAILMMAAAVHQGNPRILFSVVVLAGMFLLLASFVWALHRVTVRGKRKLQRLLAERSLWAGKRTFGLPGLVALEYLSPRRRAIYWSGILFLMVLMFYLYGVLALQALWIQAVVLTLGFFIAWSLLESVLSAEVLERSAVERELQAAHEVQMSLMPTNDPQIKGFDISGLCKPAEEVGGDYFDYIWLDEKKTKLGVAIADVSGKAMKAAMTAVMTSGMVYREIGGNETPKSILHKINKPLYLKMDRRMFTAMLFAVIDTKRGRLTFSNAGQMPPLLVRNGQIKQLKVDGVRLPLGIEEEVEYEEGKQQLKRGNVLVLYTDGIVEAMNESGELYGFERLERWINGLMDNSAREIRDKILADVQTFSGSTKQHDDMTVVVIRVTS